MEKHEAHALCYAHMNKFVRITMGDGAVYDGVIENVDDEHVYVACPIRDREGAEGEDRAFGFPGAGPGFGFYGHPFFHPFPRFRRFALPLSFLLGLSFLTPWWI